MAENASYPQIPATVWWGVRAILNKTPRATINEDLLGVELSVQPAAARQYVSELRRVGILNDENRATDLAHKWRISDTYSEAVADILASCYDDSLRSVAPSLVEKSKAVDWFMRQGLGEGAARNKAATYFLIASPEPGESPQRQGGGTQPKAKRTKSTTKKPASQESSLDATDKRNVEASGIFPVNLNLQIHISADATSEQIESIFSAMRKHLGNAKLS